MVHWEAWGQEGVAGDTLGCNDVPFLHLGAIYPGIFILLKLIELPHLKLVYFSLCMSYFDFFFKYLNISWILKQDRGRTTKTI